MSRVVIVGATGHGGGYLVPRLVGAGHEVLAVSRGTAVPTREEDARNPSGEYGTAKTEIEDLLLA